MAKNQSTDPGALGGSISQAQSTSGEPSQTQETPEETVEKAGSRKAESGTGSEIQHFDGTIVKIDKDGNEVMSDYLLPGEKLRRDTTERYAAVKPATSGERTGGDIERTTKSKS